MPSPYDLLCRDAAPASRKEPPEDLFPDDAYPAAVSAHAPMPGCYAPHTPEAAKQHTSRPGYISAIHEKHARAAKRTSFIPTP